MSRDFLVLRSLKSQSGKASFGVQFCLLVGIQGGRQVLNQNAGEESFCCGKAEALLTLPSQELVVPGLVH